MSPVRLLTLVAALAATLSFASTARAADPFASPMASAALAGTLPAGFNETTVWSGLGNPTVIRFAPDGRVFVARRAGSSTSSTTSATRRRRSSPTCATRCTTSGTAGCSGSRSTRSSRPAVPTCTSSTPTTRRRTRPSSRAGATAARRRPAPTADGCVITGRLSRLNAAGTETVLIEDFCQQYPSHSVGTIDFGPDGMLYVSAPATAPPSTSPTTARTAARSTRAATRPAAGRSRRRPRRAARCARRASAARRPRPPRSTARSCA